MFLGTESASTEPVRHLDIMRGAFQARSGSRGQKTGHAPGRVQVPPLGQGSRMTRDRDQFNKVLTLAINPGATDGEATAALRKVRELVRKDPSLAHPAIPAPATTVPTSTSNIRVTNVPLLWVSVMLSNASEQAYDLGLRIRMSCDFSQALTAIDFKCDGPENALALFDAYLGRLIVIINAPPRT
jgi:hypothetical protein